MNYFDGITIKSLNHFAQITEKNAIEQAEELIADITAFKVVQAILIFVIAYAGIGLIDHLISWLSEKVALRYRLIIKQSLPFWRAFLLTFCGVLLSNLFLNLSANNVLALTGTVAVALGFAFKDYTSSVIAGIIALFESPYQVGDRVKIGEHYGEIVNYDLRGIRLQTPDDNIVTIPHNTIWTEAVSNANKGEVEAQVIADFYFAHQADVDKIMRILYRVAQTSKYTQLSLPILVVVDETPWGTHFKLKCYPVDARDEFIYKTDLIMRAKKALAKQKIAYPLVSLQDSDEFFKR